MTDSDQPLLSIENHRGNGCTIVVCRACCCGSLSKHPGTDHDGHLEILRQAARERGNCRVRVSGCLNHCSYSNVVVVRPHGPNAHRRANWFGNMHEDGDISALADWIRAGGPNSSSPPDQLVPKLIKMLDQESSPRELA